MVKRAVISIYNDSGAIELTKNIELDDSVEKEVLSKIEAAEEGDEDQFFSLALEKQYELKYGENPHQRAILYDGNTLDYEVISDRELSYNNIIDINTATAIASEFYDVNATVAVKHAMPCGVALGTTIEDSFLKATDCDPVSMHGAVIAFSKKPDDTVIKYLTSSYIDAVIAPDYSEKALAKLKKNENLIIIKINTPLSKYKSYLKREIKITPFGTLVQTADSAELCKDTFKVVTKKKPTVEMTEDMIFAWKVVKHTRSDAAVGAKDLKTVGIAQGKTNRADAIESVLDKACDSTKDAVIAVDGFLPSIDNIYAAAQGRISGIIHQGGPDGDNEIAKLADKYDMCIISTGIRHFKH